MATRAEGDMNAPEPLARQAISEKTDPTSSRKILLIESEQDQSIYWDAVFRSLGFQVLNAASLEAAAPLLARQPSIIACSSLVSDGTGVEFFAHLRRRSELALVYLVLLTSSGEEVISSLGAGANDCIDMSAPYGEIRARLELGARGIIDSDSDGVAIGGATAGSDAAQGTRSPELSDSDAVSAERCARWGHDRANGRGRRPLRFRSYRRGPPRN